MGHSVPPRRRFAVPHASILLKMASIDPFGGITKPKVPSRFLEK